MQIPKEIILTDFNKEDIKNWIIVNDDVMGGVSSSQIRYTKENQAVFSGYVSMENNGGFASTRNKIETNILAGCSKILLRLKGDGKMYKFRLRTDNYLDGISYSCDFLTNKDKWMEIQLPLEDFIPTYRGNILTNVGPIKAEHIHQVGLLISDKQAGPFSITLDWIKCI